MDREIIIEANRQATKRIVHLTSGLSEVELNRALPNGWSIGVTLAHLAFWDQKVIYTLDLSITNGKLTTFVIDDSINDILAPILAEIPGKKALEMMLNTAEVLDSKLEECPEELFLAMQTTNPRWVQRSLHRNDHLADIEALLK